MKRFLAFLGLGCLTGCAPLPPEAYAAAGTAALAGLAALRGSHGGAPGGPEVLGGALPALPLLPGVPPGLSPSMQLVYLCLALAMFGFATLKGGKS